MTMDQTCETNKQITWRWGPAEEFSPPETIWPTSAFLSSQQIEKCGLRGVSALATIVVLDKAGLLVEHEGYEV